ncbi:MAG: dockerin type I repeat-containing protein [Prevotella sp.]|nr:dockerin type I repeat-containing protein [Prevotella sp.]
MIQIKKFGLALVAWLSVFSIQAQTDMTSAIVNPEFDGLSFAGWQQQGLWLQSNSSFTVKSNYGYVEQWVASPSTLPDAFIRQTLTNLTPGRYTLTVAAQNTNGGEAATGAVIFADWQETEVTTAGDYSLEFDVLTGDVTIGFRCENSTANWMACDNWRLTQESTSISYLRSGLTTLIETANTLAAESMDATVKSTLTAAISSAGNYTSSSSSSAIQSVATTLKEAMLAAERSIFATKTKTTGTVPTVVTDTRYARGATMIFGRSTVSSSATILEQGFCYSTTNETPTVADPRTTRYVENGGRIYCLDNLEPSTLYYIRAYAVTTDYGVGYGDPIRVYTLPMGSVTWSYGYEGDDDEGQINARISQSAMSVSELWSNLTSINGANLSVHYASGTPTADCSYGGYIRVGPTTSYQATGTVLHEMGHGIGVGTHSTYSGDIRTNNTTGYWLGKRATRFLQFWDNSDGVRLYGDATHLWASGAAQSLSYTINGAHEDAHTDASYYGNSLLMQAIVEDGLAPVSSNLQGLAYTLDSDDKTFVIRNSDEEFGLRTSYLVDNGGTLQLKELSTTEAATASNNALWTLTFDPTKQTYRIKNKQTGRYIYYASDNTSNGFKASTSTSTELDLRLQLSFVDVSVGLTDAPLTLDCYHIMRATSSPSPQAMCAQSATITGSTSFSNTNAATAQRWVFIDVDELEEVQATMDAEGSDDLDAFEITSAMAPYLCTGSLKDWTNDGMYTNYQNGGAPYYNTTDGARIDFPFIERWVSSSNSLDDTNIQQTITELPNGKYYLRGSFIACRQDNSDVVIQGATFWAGDQSVSLSTANGTPKRYMLEVEVTDGTLTYGVALKSTNVSWFAFDNLQLYYVGTEDEYYAQATPCNPVRVPLFNSTFDKNVLDGWTLDGNWQTMNSTYDNFNPPFAEWWVNAAAQADRSMSQIVTLRDGTYSLQAAVEATRQDQTDLTVSGVTLRLGDESISCHTANEAPELFTVENTVTAGDYTLGLFVESTDANWVAVDNYVLRYYGSGSSLLGDVNQDGSITIADVTALVNIILGKSDSSLDESTLLCIADINKDGSITIADVTALVNIILGK